MLLVPTLPISSAHSDDTEPLAPDDNAINGLSSVGAINAAFVPKTLMLPAIIRLPGSVKLPPLLKNQL